VDLSKEGEPQPKLLGEQGKVCHQGRKKAQRGRGVDGFPYKKIVRETQTTGTKKNARVIAVALVKKLRA